MPKRELIVWLEDARRTIDEIEALKTEIKTFSAYENANLHKRAFERVFEIIGEALFQIRKESPAMATTDINKIIARRHIIAPPDRIWHEQIRRIAVGDLALLKKELEALTEQENKKYLEQAILI